jgi:multidrug resistance efflux pump
MNTPTTPAPAAATEKKPSAFSKPWVQSLTAISVMLLVVISALAYKHLSTQVSIDRSIISAPVISISPQASGILDETYVRLGDTVSVGQPLARVGSEILSAKVAGLVIEVNDVPGQVFGASQPVVKMIEPSELRVVGTVKENEGLSDIKVGDPVSFTVDAFAGEKFSGTVESVSPTSRESGLAFSISDKREVKEFDIKVRFDTAAHPEFRNGMSAKMSVFRD